MNRIEELVYWITERDAMRMRKDTGQKPAWKYGWSDDPHMGLVRYCNVRREDDKVTRWLAQHWRPEHHAVWEIVLARMINYIPTLEAMLPALTTAEPIANAFGIMRARRGEGMKVWTSAYTISTCGASMDKVDYVMGVVQAVKVYEEDRLMSWDNPTNPGTLARAHAELVKFDGLGSFLAAQVVADLKNTQGHPLQNATDWHTWSAHGPGSLKGLSEYFGAPITPKGYAKAIAVCWNETKPCLPVHLQDLHMQDFQNCMCEFSKYMRVKRGGHARNKYQA